MGSTEGLDIRPALVVLGIDASGKNHVANVAAEVLAEAGVTVHKRSAWLSARPRDVLTSEDKSAVRHALEWLFIRAYPLHRRFLPRVVDLAIHADLALARRRQHDPNAILISHTPLRVLAFHLGHGATMPNYLARSLERVGAAVGQRTLVLDISHDVRLRRVAERASRGRRDPVDRYLTLPRNAELSERIEATLAHLAVTYFGATVVHNDDLDDEALAKILAPLLPERREAGDRASASEPGWG